MVLSTRVIVFGTLGLATGAALMWPLFVTTPATGCALSPRDWLHFPAPRIGSHFTQGTVSGGLLIVLLDPCGRFDQTVRLHIWTRRYIFAVTLQSFVQVIAQPLLILIGAQFTSLWFATVFAHYSFYFASQLLLAQITLLRLRIVASSRKTNWMARLIKLICGLIGPLILCAGFWFLSGHQLLLVLGVVLSISLSVIYVLFHGIVFREFWRVAADAAAEANHEATSTWAITTSTRARTAVVFLAASSATTFLYLLASCAYGFFGPSMEWPLQLSIMFDVPFDAILATVCAGLIGPTSDRLADIELLGDLARARRKRLIHEKLVEAARATTGPAIMLAALFQGVDPGVLIDKAVRRFRSISWDVLRDKSEIILCRCKVDGQVASADLYELSKPCRVGECDVFISHSWHDDAQQKWEALAEWCTTFQRINERVPTLWFDKLCIDQKNIAEDLQCLPIFLASCNTLLILSGLTYTSRLWCCVELFVYVNMRMEDETRHLPMIITLGDSESVRAQVNNSWANFDVTTCQCSNEEDKLKMRELVGNYPGGASCFNTTIRTLGTSLLQLPTQGQHTDVSIVSTAESAWNLLDGTMSSLSEPADCIVGAPNPSVMEDHIFENPSDAFVESESVVSI